MKKIHGLISEIEQGGIQMSEQPNERVGQLPRYQQVAVEISERIVEGRYVEGEKIHARSTLATHFNVSAETARKAISILVDLGIMDVKHGSGAFVVSKEKAAEYVTQFKASQSILSIRQQMQASIERQRTETNHLNQLLDQLVARTKNIHDQLPFVPYEIELTSQAQNLEISINELNFWHQTGATIVAIQTDKELLLSPGPYAKLSIGNHLYFVGTETVFDRVQRFFYE